MPKILYLEDEPALAELVRYTGMESGFQMTTLPDGDLPTLFETIDACQPDILLVDVMLPKNDGYTICKKIKGNENTKNLPMIFLTARAEEIDRVTGLELGVDDYITKPFSVRELFARVQAVLRRSQKQPLAFIKFGNYSIELEAHQVRKGKETFQLTHSEFILLSYMASHPEKAVSRQILLSLFNHGDEPMTARNIDVHVASLRKKLGPDFAHVETVRGIGYRFNPTPQL